MLETDEVDVDYFTPAESTSLASLFGKSSQVDEAKDNTSLKYVPPPPPNSKAGEDKPTKWTFTCTVHGFEWVNSGYIDRGKLGLAILKVIKTNTHSIILYDANKRTVSFATISPKLKVHKRDELNVSFYDNAQKCWNIQTSNEDMNKMLQLLQDLNASIEHKSFQETDREQSDNNQAGNKDNNDFEDEANKEDKEIDTDSYMNKKTKDSILKRMANMGHSVLPSHGISKGHTSDSSISDDVDGSKKNIRHKPGKNTSKKNKEANLPEPEGNIAPHSTKKIIHKSHTEVQPLHPIKSNDNVNTGDMNIFISEQRMSNSELRINVNRMSDKLDLVLERLNDVSNMDKSNSLSNFQNEIVQKLMREYEGKIKNYEDIMSSKGIDCQSIKPSDNSLISDIGNYSNNEEHKNQIEQLKKACIEKDTIIASLQVEIKDLNEKDTDLMKDNKKKIEDLLKEIETLKKDQVFENDGNVTVTKQLDKISKNNEESDTVNKIKKIMNDTFQSISSKFDDNELYTGMNLKAIIASVIKRTTKEAIKDL